MYRASNATNHLMYLRKRRERQSRIKRLEQRLRNIEAALQRGRHK